MSEDRRSWPNVNSRRSPKGSRNALSELITRRSQADYDEDVHIIQHLKRKRGRALATLTRKRNQIQALLTEDPENLPVVIFKLEEYSTAFHCFCEAHDTYDDVINDSDAKTESFMYFIDVKKGYLDFNEQVSIWISQIDPEDDVSRSSKFSRNVRIAELQARQESLQRRKELHERELHLKEEKLRLDMEREKLEVEEELKSLQLKEETSSRKSSLYAKPKPKFNPRSNEKPILQIQKDESPNMFPNLNGESKQDQVMERQNRIWNEIVQQQQRATLPKQHVPKFTGDPIEFCSFMRAFDILIASKEPDPSCKLYYLEQYTTGLAQQLVKGCLHMKPEEGYKKARELLEQRFGDKYKIAMAHVEKLLSQPPIKPEDAEALEKYSISLTSCKNALEGIGYLNKIENSDVMRKIVEKLPYKFQDRWRDIADNIINEKHREVTIGDIATFVEQKARCMNNPIFGKLSSNSRQRAEVPSKHRSIPPPSHKAVFASQLKETVPVENKSLPNTSTKKGCYICDGDHSVAYCPTFKEKTYKERMELVSKNRLCFSCLRKGHQSVSCFKKKPCDQCTKRHHYLLHSVENNVDQVKDTATTSVSTTGISSSVSNIGPCSSGSTSIPNHSGSTQYKTSLACSAASPVDKTTILSTVLPIVPVKVGRQDGNSSIQTYALLDTGSNASFCSESLIKRLGVSGKRTKIKLSTIGQSNDADSQIFHDLKVSDLDDNVSIKLPAVFSRPVIPVSKNEIPCQADVDAWPQFSNDVHLQFINSGVDLLIGMDVPEALKPIEVISTTVDGPYATKVKLGWVINGPTGRNLESFSPNSFRTSLQCLGCADLLDSDAYSVSKEYTKDEVKFMEHVEESIQHLTDGHYEVSLPLKDQSTSLPNNRMQAERRAESLKNKLQNNSNFREDYMAFMKDMIEKGYARKVPQDQISGIKGKIWYIPHHGVYHKKKKNKIRVVFDCSCKYQGVALNEVLLQGPDLTNNLLGVLLRFREESVALMADIEGMFLQVRVPEAERNLLRFLWWTDGKLDQEPDDYQMNVHLFGAISSPSCANFTLRHNATANKALYQEEVISTVFNNFYVDDCLKSLQSAEKAIHFIDEICRLMKAGGFRLTKWISNSREVLQSIPDCERAKEVKELDFAKDHLPAERALGVTWHVESDSFGFKTSPKEYTFTRRGLLSLVSSVYDPLGMAVPFTLTAKIIMQDLTRLKLKWDEPIPDQFSSPWKKWLSELPRLGQFSVDRCIGPGNQVHGSTEFELHHFSDASQKAYGTVSYLRSVTTSSNMEVYVHSSFILAKSRLAPLRSISVPRLELTAAALSVKSDNMLKTELKIPIKNSSFWTDSTTVLKYIMNDSRKFHTYVANRVSYIRSCSSPDQWNYVRTKLNPADACTREMSIDTFLSSEHWTTGPEFLKEKNIEKISCPSDLHTTLDGDPEVKKEKVTCAALVREDPLEAIFRRFSSFLRLKKFIALCFRLQRRFIARKHNHQLQVNALMTVGELRHAEHEIIRYVQKQAFPQELTDVSKGTNIKKTSPILKLDPILIDDLLRVGGRLSKSSLPYNSKHQVIIPKNTCIALLVIKEAHLLSGHSGREYVLSLVRQRFWIIHANALTRKVLSSCFECKRRLKKPNAQKMADLPAARITPDTPPFTNTGVDYFGPFMIKLRRSLVKRYGVIFTCLAVRAVHIEVASSLETDTFIMALRRFVARRGKVKRIYSDNGTNFIGGERELREAISQWNHEQINNVLLQKEIEWHFNPPSASHFGGTWERCIRTIRKILNAISNEQQLDDESFQTLLIEVEGIINGRPLTKPSEDPNDEEPLTPNHLLLLDRQPSLPPGIFNKNDLYVRRRWKQVQYLTDLFWKRWTREYLHLLQQRTKWMQSQRNLRINDVVLLVDESSPRNVWPIGRVVQVLPDAQGLVRRVTVKTPKGTFERPIHKLCLLEVSD